MKTTPTHEAFTSAIIKNNEDTVVGLLAGLSDKERATLSEPAMALRESLEAQNSALRAALLGTASFAQIKKLGWQAMPLTKTLFTVMTDRRPIWLQEYVEWQSHRWELVRMFMRAGLCQKPKSIEYMHGFIASARSWGRTVKSRAEWLLADPEVLQDEVWRLFETEGSTEDNLAASDKYSSDAASWENGLREISERGHLDRQRLLDASLSALARDFPQFRAGWFSRFHEAMTPTVAERSQRVDAYIGLLGSAIPPTAVMALDALIIVDKASPMPANRVLPHLAPLMLAKAKGTAKKAAIWVQTISKREPSCTSQVFDLMLKSLLHEATEIQELALRWIESKAASLTSQQSEELEAVRDSISKTLISRINSMLGGSDDQPAEEITAPSAIPTSRLDPSRTLPVLKKLDDMLVTAAETLESPLDFLRTECVLHALVMVPVIRDETFIKRTAPLGKRARHFSKNGMMAARLLSECILEWIEPAVKTPIPKDWCQPVKVSGDKHEQFGMLWINRCRLAQTILRQGRAVPPLATPTHLGGWIDPQELVSRSKVWQKVGASPLLQDQCLALLRMVPEGRVEALADCGDLSGEWGEALRYALGHSKVPAKSNPALWASAFRCREPHGKSAELERHHPGFGAGFAMPGNHQWVITHKKHTTVVFHNIVISSSPAVSAKTPADTLAAIFHLPEPRNFETPPISRFSATIWPSNMEAFFATAPDILFTRYEVDHHYQMLLEPLLDPFVQMGPMALLTLVTGLGCLAAEVRALSTDVLIAGIDDGRLVPAELGHIMNRLLLEGSAIPLQRWSKTLSDAARVSTHHAVQVRQILENTLQGEASQAPRDLVKLIELLHELIAATGACLRTASTRQFLGSLKTSGRTRKLVAALLAA